MTSLPFQVEVESVEDSDSYSGDEVEQVPRMPFRSDNTMAARATAPAAAAGGGGFCINGETRR